MANTNDDVKSKMAELNDKFNSSGKEDSSKIAAAIEAMPKGSAIAAPVASAQTSHSLTKKTYYSRGDGSRYIFWDGGIAIFQGGQFEFDPANVPIDYFPPDGRAGKNGAPMTPEEGWERRARELEYVCTIPNPVFSKVQVPLFKSDSVPLREVGHSGGGTAEHGGVGMVGSFQVGSLLQQSRG